MQKLIIALCLAVGVGIALAQPSAAKRSTGGANLHQIEKSGIRGRIQFIDNGDAESGLEVRGTDTGLDPTVFYISLVYDSGAKPSGPSACAPSTPGALSGAQMFVGAWQVDAEGNGTLNALKTGPTYVALRKIGAMSIRDGVTRALLACGKATPADESARSCRRR